MRFDSLGSILGGIGGSMIPGLGTGLGAVLGSAGGGLLGDLFGGDTSRVTGIAPGTYPSQSPLTPEGQYLWNTLAGDMAKTGKGFNVNIGGTKIPVQDPMQRRLLSQLMDVGKNQRIGQGWQGGSSGLFGSLAQMLPFLDWTKANPLSSPDMTGSNISGTMIDPNAPAYDPSNGLLSLISGGMGG